MSASHPEYTLLDPSISSSNIGDSIIRERVRWALDGLVPIGAELPTQTALTRAQRQVARSSDLAIVGGTNLLSSNMPWYRQWKLDLASVRALSGKVVLLGVGWWQYQGEPNAYTSWVLGQVLSRDHIHSVRDEYTRARLERLGFDVRNTACPTMWNLTEVSAGTTGRPGTAVVTLTDYNRDPREDQWLIDAARSRYDRVVVWPQSIRDAHYAEQLTGDFTIAPPTLAAYDALLADRGVDYVGTRLHGGIRAFDSGAWGLIVAVDNRAIEIGRDTALPVHPRGDRAAIERRLDERATQPITLPAAAIAQWREQWRAQFAPTPAVL